MPGFPVGIFTKKGFPICQKKLKLDNKLGTEKGIQRNIEGKYEKNKIIMIKTGQKRPINADPCCECDETFGVYRQKE